MPGINPQTYCTASGSMNIGIYAPIRKPIAVENMVITLAIVASRFTNEHINTVKSTPFTVANINTPITVNTAVTVIMSSPRTARYIKQTTRNTMQTVNVMIKFARK